MKNKLTKHHRVPKSRGGTNHANNIDIMRDTKHRAFHIVFENMTFSEQIEELMDINMNSVNKEFITALEDTLNAFRGVMYTRAVYKKKQ